MTSLLAYGTAWSLFVATVSVGFAIFSHRRQVNASVYLDISRQLHELYKRMPKTDATGVVSVHAAEASAALVFDSLQLMRTAYTLHRGGYLSGRLWSTLRHDAEKALRKPVFCEFWPEMKLEFIGDPDFVAYVDRAQSA